MAARMTKAPCALADGPAPRRRVHMPRIASVGAIVALVFALHVPTSAYAAESDGSSFSVTSPGAPNGVLSVRYTCDGEGISPPLQWTNAPTGTKGFAVLMDHVPPEGGHHWYLVAWGIPATRHGLPAGATDIGILGGNSVNPDPGYAPPCSRGPGEKIYTVTVFALSGKPRLPKRSTSNVGRDRLLAAVAPLTLASASQDFTYTR